MTKKAKKIADDVVKLSAKKLICNEAKKNYHGHVPRKYYISSHFVPSVSRDFSRPNKKRGWFFVIKTLMKAGKPLTREVVLRKQNAQKGIYKVMLTSNHENFGHYVYAGILKTVKVDNPFTGRKISAYVPTELGIALVKSYMM